MNNLMPRFLLLAYLFLVTACSGPSTIPVVERVQPPSEKINHHYVSEGETLFAIAWRYNINVDHLALHNNINDPLTLQNGQILDLNIAQYNYKKNSKVNSSKKDGYRKHSDLASKQSIPSGVWAWPVKGELLTPFSYNTLSKGNSGHKGVDISAKTGDPVYAANSGIVVYAGQGLPAYGKLLIIEHSNGYLSAYAHNSKLLVREGQKVKRKQKIANAGRTGTQYSHLHFEIRKRGQPVNPLWLLPKA